jgi:hypothetical protein
MVNISQKGGAFTVISMISMLVGFYIPDALQYIWKNFRMPTLVINSMYTITDYGQKIVGILPLPPIIQDILKMRCRRIRKTNASTAYWTAIASSDNGKYVTAVAKYSDVVSNRVHGIFRSEDYGNTWTRYDISRFNNGKLDFNSVAISATGEYQVVTAKRPPLGSALEKQGLVGIILMSVDYGRTWNLPNNFAGVKPVLNTDTYNLNLEWESVTCYSSGNWFYANDNMTGNIYRYSRFNGEQIYDKWELIDTQLNNGRNIKYRNMKNIAVTRRVTAIPPVHIYDAYTMTCPCAGLQSSIVTSDQYNRGIKMHKYGLEPWKFTKIEDAPSAGTIIDVSYRSPSLVDTYNWSYVCASENGRYLILTTENMGIFYTDLSEYSKIEDVVWKTAMGMTNVDLKTRNWIYCAISLDGKSAYAIGKRPVVVYNEPTYVYEIWKSSDYGASWTKCTINEEEMNDRTWNTMTVNTNTQLPPYVLVTEEDGGIYKLTI